MARELWDHGVALDAINYALDHADEPATFLRAWLECSLEEWPEYYAWLDKREAEEKAREREERKRLKNFRI